MNRALSVMCLAEGRGVDQAAVGPLSVQATGQPDRSGFTDVAFKQLTVVAARHYSVFAPVSPQALLSYTS